MHSLQRLQPRGSRDSFDNALSAEQLFALHQQRIGQRYSHVVEERNDRLPLLASCPLSNKVYRIFFATTYWFRYSFTLECNPSESRVQATDVRVKG
jgi:hypothetical protein